MVILEPTMRRKHIFTIVVVSALIALFALNTGTVYGHSPSAMNLSYDLAEQELTIGITHQVENPDTHYVDKIEVRVNDELVTTEDYSSQPLATGTSVILEITAEIGDVIKVNASCNQGGSLEQSLTVAETDDQDNEVDPASFLFFGTVLTFSALSVLRKISRR